MSLTISFNSKMAVLLQRACEKRVSSKSCASQVEYAVQFCKRSASLISFAY
jgi:hypothetical protein